MAVRVHILQICEGIFENQNEEFFHPLGAAPSVSAGGAISAVVKRENVHACTIVHSE